MGLGLQVIRSTRQFFFPLQIFSILFNVYMKLVKIVSFMKIEFLI